MLKGRKPLLVVLLVVNSIMLLGQVWPAGAPPFAQGANIAFLILNVAVLVFAFRKS